MDETANSTAGQEPVESAQKEGTTTQRMTCQSISEGSFVSKFWRAHTDQEWTPKNTESNESKIEDDVCGVTLQENLRLVLKPSHRRSKNHNHRNKNATRFHEDLKTDDLDGMVVMFQAKAEESISVVLSPWQNTERIPIPNASGDSSNSNSNSNTTSETNDKEDPSPSDNATDATTAAAAAPAPAPKVPRAASKRYDIVLGASNNTATTLRRVMYGNRKSKANSFVKIPSRVCRGFGGAEDGESDESNDASWTSYWVCLSNSRLYVGMGTVPGKECFGVLEKEEEETTGEEPQNQSKEEASEKAETTATEGVPGNKSSESAKSLPVRYVGIGNNAAFQKNKDLKVEVKNLVVTNVPPCLEGILKGISSQDDLPIVCLAPAASSSSGMDIDEDAETLELKKYMEDYKAECIVRRKRAEKYGTSYKEQPMKEFLPWTMAKRLHQGKSSNNLVGASTVLSGSGFVAGDIDFLDPKEISKREARLARFAAANKPKNGDDDESEKPSNGTEVKPFHNGLPVEQAWDKESMLRPIRRDPPPYLWKESPSNSDTMKIAKAHDPFSMYDESTKAATWISDKLHISSIDWAAFKQIRNEDLIKHLEAYSPIKYIEWLGDVSCNVCFANKASASRALVCLSNELPSPPPAQSTTSTTMETKKEEATTPKEAEIPGLPPQASDPAAPADPPNTMDSDSNSAIDLGCMTWRLGKRPIRKISNDRHGRKGTTARYLLRVATTEDVLMDRPNSWPEPPGGFAHDKVLGPKSDYAGAANKKKKHRQRPQQLQQTTKKTNSQQQQQQQQNRRSSNSKRKRGRGENGGKQNNNSNSNSKQNKKSNNLKPISNPMDLLNRGLSSSRGGFSVEEMEKERQAKKRQKTS